MIVKVRSRKDFRLPILLAKLGRRRYLCWSILALCMMVGRIALLPVLPPPQPTIQDEFSYLLAADTFAHGRLANPSPPHSEFFESMHILADPVYISKYPPGQGFMLAVGQKLAGHPYWGVVLEGALMVFLFCWMADAWLPPQWALIGGGLSAVLFFVRHYWFESYWGGSLAACGGALVVGGLGHVLRGRYRGARASLAAGAAILYFTRPYEGGVLCLCASIVLAIHLWRAGKETRRRFAREAVPVNVAILLGAFALAGWYNVRVTGRVTVMPYQLYARQIDSTPVLWVLPPPPPKQYKYANLRNDHKWEWDAYQRMRSLAPFRALWVQFVFFLLNDVWPEFSVFGLLLLMIPWARMRGKTKWLIFLLTGGIAALLVETFSMAHYSAPFTPVLLLLILGAARAVWYRLARVRWGGAVVAGTACFAFALLFFDYQQAFLQPRETLRSRFIRGLQSAGGSHLVFVDYASGWRGWEANGEWIYNGADLSSSPVIFAHLRASQDNRELIAQFPGRTVWLARLGPAATDLQVERYDPAASTALVSSR